MSPVFLFFEIIFKSWSLLLPVCKDSIAFSVMWRNLRVILHLQGSKFILELTNNMLVQWILTINPNVGHNSRFACRPILQHHITFAGNVLRTIFHDLIKKSGQGLGFIENIEIVKWFFTLTLSILNLLKICLAMDIFAFFFLFCQHLLQLIVSCLKFFQNLWLALINYMMANVGFKKSYFIFKLGFQLSYLCKQTIDLQFACLFCHKNLLTCFFCKRNFIFQLLNNLLLLL